MSDKSKFSSLLHSLVQTFRFLKLSRTSHRDAKSSSARIRDNDTNEAATSGHVKPLDEEDFMDAFGLNRTRVHFILLLKTLKNIFILKVILTRMATAK